MRIYCSSFVRLLLLGQFIAVPGVGLSQLVQPSLSPVLSSSNSVSLQHLYWHFLMYQHHLDQKANEMEKEGNSGAVVRSFVQAKLKMSDSQFEPIRRAADGLSMSLADLNTRAQQLRSLYIQSQPAKEGSLTSEQQKIHDQLKSLNDERENLITNQMNKLDNELAVNDRAALREYLTNEVAPSVITVKRPKPASQVSPLTAVPSLSGGGK
jgi:hypothetical protein